MSASLKPQREYPQPEWIETERLRLRPMEEADAELVLSWRNAPEVLALMEQQTPISLEQHLTWFRGPRLGRVDYVILRRDISEPIGVLSFKNIREGTAESGRLIGHLPSRGQGFAREASVAWFEYGFEKLGLHQIIGITHETNAANIHLNQSLGYQWAEVEPTLSSRGFVKMTLSLSDWRALQTH